MNTFNRILTLCLSLFMMVFTHTALGKNRVEGGLPWYEIEVIVFANSEQKGLDTETWPENSTMQDDEKLLQIGFPGQPLNDFSTGSDRVRSADPQAQPGVNLPEAFTFVDRKEFQLTNIVNKLRQNGAYEPLLHIAWRQPTQQPKVALPVFVFANMDDPRKMAASPQSAVPQAGSQQFGFAGAPVGPEGPNNERLYGTIRMSVSRYLHVAADLHFRSPVIQQEYVLEQSEGFFGSSEPVEKVIERNVLLDFRLVESRRMRSKEIHYYDHPLFGMIVLVTPYNITGG